MNKKKNNSRVLLILTVIFFILGIVLLGVVIFESTGDYKNNSEKSYSPDLTSGGIVSINIVENPTKNIEESI